MVGKGLHIGGRRKIIRFPDAETQPNQFVNHISNRRTYACGKISSFNTVHRGMMAVAILIGLWAPIDQGRAQASGTVTNSNITGVYMGSYNANQSGNYRNFTLSIYEAPNGAVTALFVETNGGVSGNSKYGLYTNPAEAWVNAFSMRGRYDAPTKNLRLVPVQWESPQAGYALRHLSAAYTTDANGYLSGTTAYDITDPTENKDGRLYATRNEALSAELRKQIDGPDRAIEKWGITLKLPAAEPAGALALSAAPALALTQAVPNDQILFANDGVWMLKGQTAMAVEAEVADGDRGDFPRMDDLKSDIEEVLKKNGVTIVEPGANLTVPTLSLHARKLGYFMGYNAGTEYYFSLSYKQVFPLPPAPGGAKKYIQVATWVEDNIGMGGTLGVIRNVREGVRSLADDFIKDCLKADQN
jgi:hypothetical protein